MLTPPTPGRWDSTQDIMAGRFLQPQEERVCIKRQIEHHFTYKLIETDSLTLQAYLNVHCRDSVSLRFVVMALNVAKFNDLFLGWMCSTNVMKRLLLWFGGTVSWCVGEKIDRMGKKFKAAVFVSVCQWESTLPPLSHNHCFAFKHFLFLVLGLDAHTQAPTHTCPDLVTVSLLAPLNSWPCLSHKQNKTRKLDCLSSGDKQSFFLGSAKSGHLLSRQCVRSGVLFLLCFLFLSHVRLWWVRTLSQDFRCHFHLNLGLSKSDDCLSFCK